MIILGIETSCDETSAAVVRDGQQILSNVIASQIDIHARYGGVVPEVAARSHIGEILPVITEALEQAGVTINNIDVIAVTRGPGLIGSLLIGVLTAKTLADTFGKPLVGVNHIIAHAFAAGLTEHEIRFPLLALTVSGGHTALTLYQEDLSFEVVGQTQDDAAGEAFDKVAKLLGLPYPGGPAISKVAQSGNRDAFTFPIAKLANPYDTSFSGLKTAVLRQVQLITGHNPGALGNPKTYTLDEEIVADIAASFERAAVEALVRTTQRAAADFSPATNVVGGGVAANTHLRERISAELPQAIFVPNALCGDNAAMIAALADRMMKRDYHTENPLCADSSLEVL